MSPRTGATALAALLAGSLLVGAFAVSLQDYRLQDFDCLRGAAVLVLGGRDPYDPPTWIAATGLPGTTDAAPRRTSCLGRRFAYPLWTALALVPFTLIPYPATAALWVALNLAAALGGTLLALRAVGGSWRAAPLALAVVVASQPLVITVQSGQIDGLEAGLIGFAAWALARRREGWAGAALALALMKPQLLAMTAPAVTIRALATRRSRLLVTLALGGGALLALSLAVRPGWVAPWLEETTGVRLGIARLLPTAWGFAADVTGTAAWGLALVAALVATVARLARGHGGPAELIALSTAVSLVATPHAWSYDHLVLAPAWAMLVARAAPQQTGSGRGPLLVAVIVSASVLPWSLYAVGQARGIETWSAIVPAVTAFALVGAMRLQRPAA